MIAALFVDATGPYIAADGGVTVGMVFQQQARTVYGPRIRAALTLPPVAGGDREGSSRASPSAHVASATATEASCDLEEATDWRRHSCGALFKSADGKIVGGTCPQGRPTCPLVPA